MNEVEKMYKTIFGEFAPNCSLCAKLIDCKIFNNTHNCNKFECNYKGLFTAEKQLKLIKWLSKNKNGFNVFYDTGFDSKEKHYWCCADQCYEDFNYGCHEKEFGEALAGLINELPLTNTERKQIKEILE